MKHHQQLKITDVRRRDCPFVPRLELDDFNCDAGGINARGYDLIGEDSDDFAMRLAEVNGINFDDITIATPVNPELPRYLPAIPSGSGKLFREYTPEYVAVSLKDVVSAKELKVATDIHARLGVPKKTRVILLGYGKDALLELGWPAADRHRIIAEIAKLDFHTVVPSDYSVWADQPHAERLVNQKKGVIMYKELIGAGLQAIPHITWFGRKDIDEHLRFLHRHLDMKTVAMDLQTIGPESDWERLLDDLSYFAANVSCDMRCLITGPSVPSRIEQVVRILPNVTITNGMAAQNAVRSVLLAKDLTKSPMFNIEKTDIMRTNDYMIDAVVDNAYTKKGELYATEIETEDPQIDPKQFPIPS